MDDTHFHFEREFELRFLKSRGVAFQDLFSDLMERAYPLDFQRIRPHGSTGDLKCDGYLKSQRTVYQVYGPEEIRSISRLLKKIRDDYQGAMNNWAGQIDHWVFVHNNQSGLPVQAFKLLESLSKHQNAPLIDVWGYVELVRVLHLINPERLLSLFPLITGQVRWISSVSVEQQLPKTEAITHYNNWLSHYLQNIISEPFSRYLKQIKLPIRLATSDQIIERYRKEEASLIQFHNNSQDGVEKFNDGSFTKGAFLGYTNISVIFRTQSRLIIIGEAGSGKTTLLRKFARREASILCHSKQTPPQLRTPILVDLWRFSPDHSLFDLVLSSVRRSGAEIIQEEILTALRYGSVTLLLDGLDEVSPAYRRECQAQITSFSEEYDRSHIVITSRPSPILLPQYQMYSIMPLYDIDIIAAISAQYGSKQGFRKYNFNINPKEYVLTTLHPQIRQIYRYPLALAILITLLENRVELPKNLYNAYDQYLSWVLDWEVKKGNLPSPIVAISLLEETAYFMLCKQNNSLLSTYWLAVAQKAMSKLSTVGITSGTSTEKILEILLSTGLLQNINGEIYFLHKTMMEFLAARQILGSTTMPHKDPIAMQSNITLFLCSGLQDATIFLEEKLLCIDDVYELIPLLVETQREGCTIGRFGLLYNVINFSEEIPIEFSNSIIDPEDEEYINCINQLIQTCIDFSPKAISVLKNAAEGIITGISWGSPWPLFEMIVNALDKCGWNTGAELFRQLAKLYFDEKTDAFSEDMLLIRTFYEFLDSMRNDNFIDGSKHLQEMKSLLLS